MTQRRQPLPMSSMSSSESMSGFMYRSKAGSQVELLRDAKREASFVLLMKEMLLHEIQDLPTETREENLRVFLKWLDVLYTVSKYPEWGESKKHALNL